jgi:hypothetical protein
MFEKLDKYDYQRTPLQAVAFFITYTGVGLLVGAFIPYIIALLAGTASDYTVYTSINDAKDTMLIYGVLITFLVARAKNFTLLSTLALLFFSLIGSYFCFGLLGLMPAAIITTQKKQAK